MKRVKRTREKRPQCRRGLKVRERKKSDFFSESQGKEWILAFIIFRWKELHKSKKKKSKNKNKKRCTSASFKMLSIRKMHFIFTTLNQFVIGATLSLKKPNET